uniref:Uncharacterized protein n=1 Tax=Kalanchoe fedtschenkoi TaxID=63787 RepID=A0A7N0TZ11_KALFE
MKIFGWMQDKLGRSAKNAPNAAPWKNCPLKKEAVKEELSDWPRGLLTIGTFGSDEPGEIPHREEEDPASSPDFTPQEVCKLRDELKKLLSRKSASKNTNREIRDQLPLDKFLNCPSSLEVERRIRSSFGCEADFNRTISAILGKCKEVSAANKKKDIGKKSISFLLKKMFAAFAPGPSLRDPLPESRMEKLLRAVIYKTRFPQPSARPSSAARYLENRKKSESDQEGRREKARDQSKWVKTDSEYIVLEI